MQLQGMGTVHFIPMISFYLLFFISEILAASATDTMSRLQSLSENQTLVSKNGNFELGFFTPGNSGNCYLGIWYANIPVKTVVWVANRETPINDMSGVLRISTTQNILLLSQNKTVLWSSKAPAREAQSPVLQLLDSGNLVLKEQHDENYLWQSFDYPCDTLLPGMKLGKDLRTGLDRRITAWKDENDPSPGTLTWGMDVTNYPEPMTRIGSKKQYNSGPWIGPYYSSQPTAKRSPVFEYIHLSNENEVYYMILLLNNSVKGRIVLNQTSKVHQHSVWIEAEQRWKMYVSVPRDFCDKYGACGPNGICDESKLPDACDCLKGFKPKSHVEWNGMNYEEGCVRDRPLNCQDDGFFKYVKMKLPDTERSWLNQSMSLLECRAKCSKNCSCMAYANSDIRGAGSGCAMWFGDLNDLRVQPDAGQDLYVRVPASVLDTNNGRKAKLGLIVGITSAIMSGILLALCCIGRSRLFKEGAKKGNKTEEMDNLELPLFNLSRIASATNNFSIRNKLGQGGFGSVYKGTLEDGQEIAVKRLSRSSCQGLNELNNEVNLIVKLQHRNLVKLLGCCIENEEKLLIYEYMPNKGLDSFIFDQARGKLLDWSKRFNIICGIARGLLYLHQDSRLKVIHRDLKASNVLLDGGMNPKISDFGLARTFGGDLSVRNTKRVVGTYGYMAPEYAIDGHFSVKSDVFSFGIVLLEIVTGKKNSGLYGPNDNVNLLGLAWNLWTQGRQEELIDECLRGTCNPCDVLHVIQISLLCLQQHPQDRPTMSTVVLMLDSRVQLPKPKQPGFFLEDRARDGCSISQRNEDPSINGLSITEVQGR